MASDRDHTREATYAAALRDYLNGGGEASLRRAFELGCEAIDDGLGAAYLVELHREAMTAILEERRQPESLVRTVGEATQFLARILSPVELTHGGCNEAVTTLRHMNEVLEEEAHRIAQSLHDEAGYLLVSAHLALEEAAASLPARTGERLHQVHGLLDDLERHLRCLSHELRPVVLDDLGLIPALEFLAKGVAARTGIPVQVEGPRSPRLPRAVETALYRVVQEALNNATKHAGASQVQIGLELDEDRVRCWVKDDGRGFDVSAVLARKGRLGLGLTGMRERLNALGSDLMIHSAPGKGTELRINLSLSGCHAVSPPPRA
jgi:signal transduction histidine kinase